MQEGDLRSAKVRAYFVDFSENSFHGQGFENH